MSSIGVQVGAHSDKIVASITQDTLPIGASDHFYLSHDGGLLYRPGRPADIILVDGGHDTVEIPVPFQGQLCSVTAWRVFSDGSTEKWGLDDPPAYFYWDKARFYTTVTDYYSPACDAPWTTVDGGGYPDGFTDDFRHGLRHWVNEYGWTNSQHRTIDDETPTTITVPAYRHLADLDGDPDYDGVPEYATEVEVAYDDGSGNIWHNWTVPAHTMTLTPSSGWTDGKKGLLFHNTGAPRVDSFSPGIVPTVSLDPKQDWEIELRRWNGGDVFKGETGAGYEDCIIVAWGGEFLYEYVGWLKLYGQWGTYKAKYDAATKEISFYTDGWFNTKHAFNADYFTPAEYTPRKPFPDLPVKLWLASSTDTIESVTLRGRIPYYWACDVYEFRHWQGFGDTFSLAWGAESYWDDPHNYYGMRDAVGNYSQAGGIAPKAPTPMFPTGWNWSYASYPVAQSTNILTTGAWGATSPRFHASEWHSLRYLARRGSGTMTIKVVDADTDDVLASSTPPETTPTAYTTLDLSGIGGDTVIQIVVEGNNTTTDYNTAARLFSLEIDAVPVESPYKYALPAHGASVSVGAAYADALALFDFAIQPIPEAHGVSVAHGQSSADGLTLFDFALLAPRRRRQALMTGGVHAWR